jgi:hypothetical protein
MFGDVPRLERLAEMLHRASEGNPAHMMELIEHLVRQQVISYSDATWVLPDALDRDTLPKGRSAVLMARLARLPGAVRAFAQTLSLNPRVIPIELCPALSGRPAGETFAALELLVREGVLTGSPEGYAFTHEALRRVLCDELEPEPRRAGHRVLGESMLADGELPVADQLQAGVHLMLGGDDERGRALVVPAARDLAASQMEHLAGAVPCLEQALALLRTAQRPEHEQLSLLAALASAGYYVDRKLAERYGQQATELFERVMGLSRARRWRRFLGRKLAILLSLLATGVTFWRRRNTPCALAFNDAMLLLFNTVATLAGTYSVCLDPEGAARAARVIEPLSALGEDHIAGLMYR